MVVGFFWLRYRRSSVKFRDYIFEKFQIALCQPLQGLNFIKKFENIRFRLSLRYIGMFHYFQSFPLNYWNWIFWSRNSKHSTFSGGRKKFKRLFDTKLSGYEQKKLRERHLQSWLFRLDLKNLGRKFHLDYYDYSQMSTLGSVILRYLPNKRLVFSNRKCMGKYTSCSSS